MSMLLKSDDGVEFELALEEDRFPDIQDDFEDSGYTTIRFRINTPDESWEETAPCLNIFELKNLEEWLDAVAHGKPEVSELEILEPELKFSVSGDSGDEVTVRIGFNHEEDRTGDLGVPEASGDDARPPAPMVEAPLAGTQPDEEKQCVDIRLPREMLAAAAAALHRDIESATTAHPDDASGDEEISGLLGIPDEGLNLLDEDSPAVDETDPDRKF